MYRVDKKANEVGKGQQVADTVFFYVDKVMGMCYQQFRVRVVDSDLQSVPRMVQF